MKMIPTEFAVNHEDGDAPSSSTDAKDEERFRTKLDDNDMKEIRQAMCINLVQGIHFLFTIWIIIVHNKQSQTHGCFL